MLRPILWATILVATVFASGEFVVLHTPGNIVFEGKEEIDHRVLKDLFTTILGFTIEPGTPWSGISTSLPFKVPEAIVVVAVEGVQHLESQKENIFPLKDDYLEEVVWQSVNGILVERSNDNKLVRMRMADGVDALGKSALGTLKPTSIDKSTLNSLSIDNEDHRKFLEEMKLLDAIAKNVPSVVTPDGNFDLYWFVVSGMQPLVETYGDNSPVVKESLVILNDALNNLTEAFTTVYKNEVVIAAFTNNANKARNARSINLSRERREIAEKDDIDKNIKTSENSSSTPVIDIAKNDEEEIEKNEDEDAKTRTIDEGSSLKKSDESPLITEGYETEIVNTGTEANEARENNTVNSSLELEDTTRNNEQSYTKTVNTNRSLKVSDLNHAKDYSENYPVIFNIFLWFGVVFFFSLLAICITIADMDPGRDSIIYRMTSTRMKKDN